MSTENNEENKQRKKNNLCSCNIVELMVSLILFFGIPINLIYEHFGNINLSISSVLKKVVCSKYLNAINYTSFPTK